MLFDDVVYGRRSVRDFLPDPVPEADLAAVIEAAVQAPDLANEQPWVFTVVRDQQMLDRVSRQARAYVLGHSAFGVRPSPLRDQLARADFQIFYHAPALIVISSVQETPFAVETCALAAQNLMLAAHARGLGTCWVGFAQPWIATDDGKTALRLPAHYRPVAPIAIGRPRSVPERASRRRAAITWS